MLWVLIFGTLAGIVVFTSHSNVCDGWLDTGSAGNC